MHHNVSPSGCPGQAGYVQQGDWNGAHAQDEEILNLRYALQHDHLYTFVYNWSYHWSFQHILYRD